MHVNFFTAGETSSIRLIMPEHVNKNEDIHGYCITTKGSPRIIILRNSKCNFKIEINENLLEKNCTDFVIKNVTATCQYRCAISGLFKVKSVVVAGTYVLAWLCMPV